MSTICTRCNINWAVLWADTDAKADEEYEFCPQCKSGLYLQYHEHKEGGYVKCRMTGEIKHSITGEQLIINTQIRHGNRQRIVYDEPYSEYYDRRKQREDNVLKRFNELISVHGREKAWQMANDEVPIVKRKFHYE